MEHNPTIEDMFKYETRPNYSIFSISSQVDLSKPVNTPVLTKESQANAYTCDP